MDKFIYFNARLTEKLNAVYEYPITLVSGRPGTGKRFAIQTILRSRGTETAWHASKAVNLQAYLWELQKNSTIMEYAISEMTKEHRMDVLNPAELAIQAAVELKERLSKPFAYVLEYQDGQAPEDILELLINLSSQRVRGLHIVLIVQQPPPTKNLISTSINMISEEAFLLTPDEIEQAFLRNGLAISDSEAGYLYLCSAGWMPEVTKLYHYMLHAGKTALYENWNRDGFLWESSENWKNRFDVEAAFWNMPELHEVRWLVEAMDLEKAFIALERARIKSRRFSAAWDLCDYYNAILQALSGKARIAMRELKQGFELRIHQGLYKSAYRIHLAQIQLRILLGNDWFEENRELISIYADRRIYEGVGISRTMAGLTLWQGHAYQKLIAFFGEFDDVDDIEAGYRELLLAVAYKRIGFEEEAAHHLETGLAATTAGACLSLILLFDTVSLIQTIIFTPPLPCTNNIQAADMPPEFQLKLAVWRRAMRKNSIGSLSGTRHLLTMREMEIVKCVSLRMSNKEIAAHLNISENTVKTILKHVFQKLDIKDRRELQ